MVEHPSFTRNTAQVRFIGLFVLNNVFGSNYIYFHIFPAVSMNGSDSFFVRVCLLSTELYALWACAVRRFLIILRGSFME